MVRCAIVLFTVTKHTLQTQDDLVHSVWAESESIYEWVALNQRGELDLFIVCEVKERGSGSLSWKLEKA